MVIRDLYFFNPTCETAIANGSETYMAAQILRKFEDNLSFLPMIFTSPGDIVLSSEKPSKEFIGGLKQINFPLSDSASKDELLKAKNLKINRIVPWGWSPAAHFQLKELKNHTIPEFQLSRIFNWVPEHRTLFERKTAAQILNQFINEYGTDEYCSPEAIPSVVQSEDEIQHYLKNCPNAVLKSPVSSSGRGVQMIRNGKLSRSNSQWAKAVLKQSGYLMAEPLHHKKLDLSFQFEIDSSGKIIYRGHVFFYTNNNGMYQGHYLNRNISELVGTDFTGLPDKTGDKLKTILEKSAYPAFYEGFLGIDGMIIEEENQLKIHPCLEINCRLTMGMIALKIQKLIHPEAKGRFEIFSGETGEFAAFSEEMKTKYPIVLRNKQFYSGFTTLSDPAEKAKFGAYILLI
ncbi:MAG: hypothetical protein A2W90_10230 [Bacteroidetes bacterium GWF2_42_66]|nr:MAG: hypothetical protein A2W92_15500 [Bacteroidetes bacterium GWA2_42_15]OFX97464.1 MAG: hypothetical protein A2W89_01175 [Bacteroidetes bacterium GWE2_42_39]OFY43841.1 MAG: hypothetical protein A2W90_10230 [Bacteroidetes bacterium GWF2_42_66]HBL76172.1 hypothetical protein [Prolixibacteraceae bacterium]HCR91967.1 hypothetical protein [Prolixibacteraceae bacterium]